MLRLGSTWGCQGFRVKGLRPPMLGLGFITQGVIVPFSSLYSENLSELITSVGAPGSGSRHMAQVQGLGFT